MNFLHQVYTFAILIIFNLVEGIYIPYSPLTNTYFPNYFTPVHTNDYIHRGLEIPLNDPIHFNSILPVYPNQQLDIYPLDASIYQQQEIVPIPLTKPEVEPGYPLLGRHIRPVLNYNTAGGYTSDVGSNDNDYYYAMNPLGNLFSKFSLPRVSLKLVKEIGDIPNIPMADCELMNKTIIKHGTSIQVFCDVWACLDGEIIKPTPPEYATECPDDFTIVDKLGCVKLFDEKATWCDARRACFELGADLVSLDNDHVPGADNNNINVTAPLQTYVTNAGVSDVWVGLSRTKRDIWDWTIGLGQIPFISEAWKEDDPNGPGQWQCVRYEKDNGLTDRLCDDRSMPDGGYFPYICEVPGHDYGCC